MRISYYVCCMKQEKRNSRSYKTTDAIYKKAMKRAKKDGGKLSNIVENVVLAYSYGLDVKAVKMGSGVGHALDIFTENFSIRLNEINLKTKKQ